ncbi:MAG: hypothetical protein ACJAZ8_001641 [Planctomycetota bacterium]|jgi:hypothetical protein
MLPKIISTATRLTLERQMISVSVIGKSRRWHEGLIPKINSKNAPMPIMSQQSKRSSHGLLCRLRGTVRCFSFELIELPHYPNPMDALASISAISLATGSR